jgi:hypothetical protein
MRRITATLAGLAAVVLIAGGPAAGATEDPANQCVVHVVDQEPSGELVLSEPECFQSFEQAMGAEGIDAADPDAALAASATAVAALAGEDPVPESSFVIGYHYDGFNFGGASISVVGTDCAGGYTNLSATWSNRISSTRSGCPRIRHYNGANKTGSSETTFSPGGNLSSLNNAASSIQYLS